MTFDEFWANYINKKPSEPYRTDEFSEEWADCYNFAEEQIQEAYNAGYQQGFLNGSKGVKNGKS